MADPSAKSLRRRLKLLEKSVSKKVGRAIADYRMIRDGDKLLVAVSGGKDSLTLLKILNDRRAFVPIRYEILAVHVDLGAGSPAGGALKSFFKKNGIPFVFRKKKIFDSRRKEDISCFWCSWNRRKVLFETAQKYGCNKIALGHHKDDIVQTVLMNLLFEGEISAMAPYQELFKGKLALIRPLAYVEERDIEALAQSYDFKALRCRCPQAGATKRAHVAKFIRSVEAMVPGVKTNIFKSLRRVKKDYLL